MKRKKVLFFIIIFLCILTGFYLFFVREEIYEVGLILGKDSQGNKGEFHISKEFNRELKELQLEKSIVKDKSYAIYLSLTVFERNRLLKSNIFKKYHLKTHKLSDLIKSGTYVPMYKDGITS